ncbi:hypothetical protein DL766_004780 [Monosporascus sp. MC13-8B]|uniref:RING-type domain-containing protein n=1 Tax=Monosporascus cannonballus TaxID=155416 RepID=A0ABY0H2L7_9PEZI|nr:hypothetical protein DL762_006606 [Monosporascus cannonballus]RYO93463.1 hypothetical protein DL763_004366 [Monosporascus cannonballus]RYP30598.1 hypothetical protein DL766_004780 [Monosporascus sp. MC13-8B]
MDPAEMDFVMHHHQPSERPVTSSIDQAARSPCPALRAAVEQGHLPRIFPPNGGPPHYDPFHSNSSSSSSNNNNTGNNGNTWRADSHHYPHNSNPYHHGWRQPVPVSQTRPMPQSPYSYPDPFATTSGYPHQDQGSQHLFPMMNPPENQNTQGPLPSFNYGANLPSMMSSNTAHFHHGRNGSQSSDMPSRTGSLPPLNANPHQFLPTASTHPSRAPIYIETSTPLPLPQRDPMGISDQFNPLQAGPFPPQGTSTSNSRHRAEPDPRAVSADGGGIFHSASRSPPPPQPAASQSVNDPPPSQESPSEERRRGAIRTRRATPVIPRLPPSSAPGSESSSDEDGDAAERSLHGYGFLELIGTGFGLPEDRVRAQQLLRGTMSGKRVASKSAIASLQSVKIADLPQGDRVCVICYNDYGVQNPEGINEAPLRLPRCKHVFGDHCIKKWFEEHDTCPYCRDKVPSEPQGMRFGQQRSHQVMQYLQQQHAQMQAMRRYQAQNRESNPAGSSDNHARSGRSAAHHSVLADLYAHGTPDRLAPWAAYPPLAERRSPSNETENTRRRPRARVGGPRSSPSTRSFGGFAGSVPNGSPQNAQPLGTNTHNGRHPATLPVPSNGPGFEIYLPSLSMVSQLGTQPEQFQNPLAGVHSATAVDNFRGTVPPMAPTMAGPEVDMTSPDQSPHRTSPHRGL